MAVVEIGLNGLNARVGTRGGIVLRLWWERGSERIPLLRPAPNDDVDALQAGCYPLVPFANRVAGNRFSFGGRDYAFSPNTTWDPHYLHGEGWLAEWTVLSQSDTDVLLGMSFSGEGTPYAYEARQRFAIAEGAMTFTLSVSNRGPDPLPFGLGWHPYFPMTPETTLQAKAERFWTEIEGWMPGEASDLPADLDFSLPRPLPHRWVNNGFENWDGTAEITWPERRAKLRLTADPLFRHAFVFVSDSLFDPTFKRDYFCFEPMSHLANGHNLPDLGDLKILNRDETLSGSITLRPEALA